MKKYLAFSAVMLKSQLKGILNEIGTVLSFIIHIIVFSFLWDFVLDGKEMAGYTKQDLIWYVIMAEAVLYSFHYFYRKVAYKVEMGDFAYDMTKPYNFLLRVISEGVAELPLTAVLLVVGAILGIMFVGLIDISMLGLVISMAFLLLATILLLLVNIIVGLLSIWLGRDVSSVWLLCQKAMLIFAFTPVELFPLGVQKVLLMLPTTHVIYTPASLLVHFNHTKCIESLFYMLISFVVLALILWIIYKKGVKKQNVNGI